MIVTSIRVKNLRSIKDETLSFDNLTALVGSNGSGKSSFLYAMKLYSDKSPKWNLDDYYDKDTTEDIVISVTFSNLSPEALTLFSKYVQNNELTVERIFKWNDGRFVTQFHGSLLQNPDFVETNNAENATEGKKKYEELKRNSAYSNFPPITAYKKIKEYLQEWETKNPDQCKRLRDDGKFFGFHQVGQGHLGKFIKFFHIPAVRDATTDGSEGKGSILTELMDLVIRNKIAEKPEIKQLEDDIRKKYKELLDPAKLTELTTLANGMTQTLQHFVPDAKIDLVWESAHEFQIDMPSAVAELVEDGYQSTVARTGHGLQRAFIMTMLQHLSVAQNTNEQTESAQTKSPNLVLIIEEPELYQHPNRQRHLAEVFLALSKGRISGVSEKMQVVYSTHSPHFVGLDRINQIRLLRKQINANDKPKATKISSTTITALTAELLKFHGDKFSESNLIPRLHMIRTPWINEGFFSKCAVLVEGDSDRAALLGASKALNIDLESQGISIIPCFGKGNLDKVAIIFKQLDIPTYVIWDNDRKNDKDKSEIKNNKILLKLFGQEEIDYPSHVGVDHACIEGTLESMLKSEIGEELYETMLNINMTEYDLKKGDALKNPTVLKTMLEDLEKSGGTIPDTLKQILQNIQQLNSQ